MSYFPNSEKTCIDAEDLLIGAFVIIDVDNKAWQCTMADIHSNEITHPNGVALETAKKGATVQVKVSGTVYKSYPVDGWMDSADE